MTRLVLLLALPVLALAACAPVPTTSGATSAAAPAGLSTAQIASLVADPSRSEADRRNDVRRKPAELLAFIGVRPGMVALDLSSGGGYTTELLARAVGPTGRVYGQSRPRPESGGAPAAVAPSSAPVPALTPPPRTSALLLAERSQRSGLTNISAVVQPFEAPVPGPAVRGGLDLVTIMFDYHDLGFMGVNRAAMNAAVFAALKPAGLYVIADHAGRPGTGISESNTLHRIEESFLRSEIEAAGFRLAAEGSFLRNPADPRDRETPEGDIAKDDFVLKFVKP